MLEVLHTAFDPGGRPFDGYPVEGADYAESWMHPEGSLSARVAGSSGEVLGHAAICDLEDGDAAAAMLMKRLDIPATEIAVLARLFVGPTARRSGTGQRLAEAALAYAVEHRRRAVFDVMEKDSAAIRMYERLGCVMLGRTSHQVAGGRVVPALCFAAPGVLDS
ncbi:GNAT family N-acetyltransferase [Actinoplanes sp. RD1]|uniref:GNAT family N-acetyltransferase n=1 Tax=Actinoplanes sp. RD1 TaxID=3064538 RepID=UPI002742521F|nr:GNAT family N-acetyltransferase [Actinoplanes sp. RD1]